MKKYVRSATDRSNKMTQTKSKKFSEDEISRRAAEDSRRGESMQQIYRNIMNDPDVEFGDADAEGNQTLFYKGTNVGWINFRRGMGDINNKVYTQIKHAAKARPDYGNEDVFVDDSYEDYSDVEFDDDEE